MNSFSALFFKVFVLAMFAIGLSACVKDVKQDTSQSGYEAPKNISVDSDVEDAFNSALGHLKAERYDEAIALLLQVIEEEKRVAAPFVNLGMAYDKKGDVTNAEKYLLEAVNVDLAHPVANNQLGLLYRKQGKFDDARKAYSNALTRYPDYLPVIRNLGILCELYIRDLPCALSQYEHYQSLRPDDKTMNIWIADLSRRVAK